MRPIAPVPHVCRPRHARSWWGRKIEPIAGAALSAAMLSVAMLIPLMTSFFYGSSPQPLGDSSGPLGAGTASFKVGSFVPSGTLGLQTIAHGLGETPKAIIFFTSGSDQAVGTWRSYINQAIGFTAGPTSSYSVSGAAADGAATSNTGRRMAAKAITITNNGISDQLDADLSSWDATNFVLDWTDVLGTFAPTIGFLAIGGAGVQAKVVNWQTPTATGNKAVTGLDFLPDLVFHTSNYHTLLGSTTHHIVHFGAMNSAGEQWANSVFAAENSAAANTSRFQRTDRCIAGTTINDVSEAEASFVSMDYGGAAGSGGFTLNHTVTQPEARQYASLCLSGVTSKIGFIAKTTAAAPAAQSVNAGFQPEAVLFSSTWNTASTSPAINAFHAVGASDGTNSRAVSQTDADGVDPTNANGVFYDDAVAIRGDISGGNHFTSVKGMVSALTATGFDLSFDPNNGTADEILYVALKEKATLIDGGSDAGTLSFEDQTVFAHLRPDSMLASTNIASPTHTAVQDDPDNPDSNWLKPTDPALATDIRFSLEDVPGLLKQGTNRQEFRIRARPHVPAVVSDSFNRANSTTSLGTADSGQAWTANNGTWGISSNQAYLPSGGASGISTIDTGVATGTVQVTVPVIDASGGNAGMVVRYQDANNNFRVMFNRTDSKIYIQRILAGTTSNVFLSTGTYAAGVVIKTVVTSSTLSVYVNGTKITDYSDSNLNGATKQGLWINNGTGWRLDDYSVNT